MKFKNITLVLLCIIILTGCSNSLNSSYTDAPKNVSNNTNQTNENNDENNNIPTSTNTNIEDNKSDNTTSDKTDLNNSQEQKTIQTQQNGKIEYTDNDMKVINEFNNIEDNVNTLLNSPTSEDIKTKAKGTFISIVDFIFYDGKINDITFEQLTDTGKEEVLKIANSIDNKIENKYPNYKETITDKTKAAFLKASELIKIGANNFSNFSKEKLGEDNYNTLLESKDNLVYYTKNAFSIVGKISSNIFETSKNYLKIWYEQFKNN